MASGALAGWRVLVTRTREQSSTLSQALRELGAEVLEIPLIRIEPPSSYAALDAALATIGSYDTLIVTSANTAAVLRERRPLPWPWQPYTVAVGPATAQALATAGLRVDLVPTPAVAESVLAALAPGARGKRMLLVRAAVARDVLPDGLRAAGADLDVVDAYRTIEAPEAAGQLGEAFGGTGQIDAVTFTSSSTAEHFVRLLTSGRAMEVFKRTAACSIGPITSQTLRSLGVEPATEAAEHTVAGLVKAIESYVAGAARARP